MNSLPLFPRVSRSPTVSEQTCLDSLIVAAEAELSFSAVHAVSITRHRLSICESRISTICRRLRTADLSVHVPLFVLGQKDRILRHNIARHRKASLL